MTSKEKQRELIIEIMKADEKSGLYTTRKQTAVDWLVEKLDNNLDINHSWRTRQYIEQAKQMEKEQIINAWISSDNELQRIAAEKYYNETFKK